MAIDKEPAHPGGKSSARVPTVGVVTVTHNSDSFFDVYMDSLARQTVPPDLIVVVDSGSANPAFLDRARNYSLPVEVIREPNVGYSVANNIGWRRARALDYVVFLNPDAFLTSDFLKEAVAYMEREPTVGMLAPTLLRYDIEQKKVLDRVDTTGVVRNRFGFITERDQGAPSSVLARYSAPNEVPWLCAAVLCTRREAMEAVVEGGEELFDESFFMYKEDTDLSWRVRRAGWKNIHHPGLLGFHCRGWQDRKRISRRARLLTARNEIKMCLKNRSPFVVVGLLKYSVVRLFNI